MKNNSMEKKNHKIIQKIFHKEKISNNRETIGVTQGSRNEKRQLFQEIAITHHKSRLDFTIQ